MTMVARRVRWESGVAVKTLLIAFSPTLEKAAGEVVKAVAVAKSVANERNFMMQLCATSDKQSGL
jgi:hypothetical protein